MVHPILFVLVVIIFFGLMVWSEWEMAKERAKTRQSDKDQARRLKETLLRLTPKIPTMTKEMILDDIIDLSRLLTIAEKIHKDDTELKELLEKTINLLKDRLTIIQ